MKNFHYLCEGERLKTQKEKKEKKKSAKNAKAKGAEQKSCFLRHSGKLQESAERVLANYPLEKRSRHPWKVKFCE